MQTAKANTDRELWREPDEGYGMGAHMPSIHVTAEGGIGINVGGMVHVKTLRQWHALAVAAEPRKWDEDREARAKAIYDAMPYDGLGSKPAWVPHGNSLKQSEARSKADLQSQIPAAP
jgi:hypothetical protein